MNSLNNPTLTPFAQRLRRDMTKEERHLWYDFLKQYPIQFKRQKVIGSYIADFYCPSAMLVIELDGSQHYEDHGKQYDQRRTRYIQELGVYVLRFPNNEVMRNFPGVCDCIDMTVKELLSQKASPHVEAGSPIGRD